MAASGCADAENPTRQTASADAILQCRSPGVTRAMRHALAASIIIAAAAAGGCGGASEFGGRAAAPADHGAPVPRDVEDYIHETFHRLPSSCARGGADSARLDATTAEFIALYRRFGDRSRMTIDDESGSMLSAILVLRDELSRCSPRHAARIDPLLPPSVRRALRPLRSTDQ